MDRVFLEATFLLERGIDGLMLVGDLHRPELLARIDRHAMPTVQTFTLSQHRACIGFDNAAAMAKATKYLLDLGHRRFGIITGTRCDNDHSTARVAGVVDTLAAHSLQVRAEHDI